MKKFNIVTGVDIGGTHITACKVNIQMGNVLEKTRIRLDINANQDAEQVIEIWSSAIRKASAIDDFPLMPIGIAMPGPFDYEKGISLISGLHKYEKMFGVNIKDRLASALQISPDQIRMINDATAYLLGEISFATTLSDENIVGVTLGTGLGSAVYRNGNIEEGDLWSMPYKDRRAEDYLSARWLVKTFGLKAGSPICNVRELAVLASKGDEVAISVFIEFGTCLADVLMKRYGSTSYFPSVIIVGGNIAKAWDFFALPCLTSLRKSFPNTRLLCAQRGEDAALMGAAYLWND